MTTQPTRRRPPTPSPLGVIAATLGLFLVVLTLLAIQVRSGRDPALGPGIVSPPSISRPAAGTAAGTTAEQATTVVTRTSPVPPP